MTFGVNCLTYETVPTSWTGEASPWAARARPRRIDLISILRVKILRDSFNILISVRCIAGRWLSFLGLWSCFYSLVKWPAMPLFSRALLNRHSDSFHKPSAEWRCWHSHRLFLMRNFGCDFHEWEYQHQQSTHGRNETCRKYDQQDSWSDL